MKPGRQKILFLSTLQERRPELLPRILEMYSEELPSGAPTARTMHDLRARIDEVQRSFAMPALMPHRSFARLLPPHDVLRVLFRDMVELYGARSVETSELRRSADRYDAWLISLRRQFRRRRTLPTDWLEGEFATSLRSGLLGEVLDNSRLLDFVRACVVDGAFLNYVSLKLEQ